MHPMLKSVFRFTRPVPVRALTRAEHYVEIGNVGYEQKLQHSPT